MLDRAEPLLSSDGKVLGCHVVLEIDKCLATDRGRLRHGWRWQESACMRDREFPLQVPRSVAFLEACGQPERSVAGARRAKLRGPFSRQKRLQAFVEAQFRTRLRIEMHRRSPAAAH